MADRMEVAKSIIESQEARDHVAMMTKQELTCQRSENDSVTCKRMVSELEVELAEHGEEAASKVRKVMNSLAKMTYNAEEAVDTELATVGVAERAAKNYVEDLTSACMRFHEKIVYARGENYLCPVTSKLELSKDGVWFPKRFCGRIQCCGTGRTHLTGG